MSAHNLIIDDDEISLLLVEKLLKKQDSFSEPIKFFDAKNAYQYLEKNYSSKCKYRIFLDINMPLMDGWEFLDEASNLLSKKNTCVYILSSSNNKIDKIKSEEYDLVKGFISKPLRQAHINNLIN